MTKSDKYDADHNLLEKFVSLNQWFTSQPMPPQISSEPAQHYIWMLAKALKSPPASRCKIWTDFQQVTVNQILAADEFAGTHGVSVTDLYGLLAEAAIFEGSGQQAWVAIKKLAEHTTLPSIRFLSAWLALNLNQLNSCIDECEAVSEPFAPIHALLGQAYLENGQTELAIDSLKVAIKLDPRDPVPVVQLIKAFLVCGRQAEAILAIESCRKIVSDHIEIDCLAAMAILAGPLKNMTFCEITLMQFEKHLKTNPNDFDAFSLGLEIALKLNLKNWAHKLSDLLQIDRNVKLGPINSKLSQILKMTNDREWHDLSRKIIDKTMMWAQSLTTDQALALKQ